MSRAAPHLGPGPTTSERNHPPSPAERGVRVRTEEVELDADFTPPAPRSGTVIFAHGSGSGRRSPRNRQVARALNDRGLGTLLLDLLTEAEARADEATAEYRFDIPLLTRRLLSATDWLLEEPQAARSPVGYFGASTGGAVAMRAAARLPHVIRAIVLRGARSDLGDEVASQIRCATLIVVGGLDPGIRVLNEHTMQRLSCPKSLVVVPGASHLFEEKGTLEAVAKLAGDWFARYLVPTVP